MPDRNKQGTEVGSIPTVDPASVNYQAQTTPHTKFSTALAERTRMDIPKDHILYLEDHADTRELGTLVLKRHGYRVTTAANGSEAMKLAREESFALYILDTWLPDGSGIELCKRLREFDTSTPIMFLSAAAYETDRQAALNSGAQGYLTKPVGIHELGNEVKRLLAAFADNHDQTTRPLRDNSPLPEIADERRSEIDSEVSPPQLSLVS